MKRLHKKPQGILCMLKSIIDEYKVSQPLLCSCDHDVAVWLFSHENEHGCIQCLFDVLIKDEKKRAAATYLRRSLRAHAVMSISG
jgi:hypothetical protein